MKFQFLSSENLVNVLRRAGYTFQRHIHESEEMSFVRPLSRGAFPRFHIYAQNTDDSQIVIHIHLDHKRETYGNDTRHHGEYDGAGALLDEVKRLKALWNIAD